MTPAEFSEAIEALNLNQTTAGYWLNVDRRTIHNYASGHQTVPTAMAMLLRTMLKLKLKPDDIH